MTAPVTLHREINALGGVPSDQYGKGYNDAIGHALAILERRGFTEAADAVAAPEADAEGWIEHDGSECPVGASVEVQLRVRRRHDGSIWERPGSDRADWFKDMGWWTGEGRHHRIVAYRIVQP